MMRIQHSSLMNIVQQKKITALITRTVYKCGFVCACRKDSYNRLKGDPMMWNIFIEPISQFGRCRESRICRVVVVVCWCACIFPLEGKLQPCSVLEDVRVAGIGLWLGLISRRARHRTYSRKAFATQTQTREREAEG